MEGLLFHDILQWSLQNHIHEYTNDELQERGAVKDPNADMGQGSAFAKGET